MEYGMNKRVMQLLVDNGIYFEFVPFNEENFDENGNIVENPKTLTLSEVEVNTDYALLLSTCAGTWRYLIGDTIKFLPSEGPLLESRPCPPGSRAGRRR